MRKIVFFANTSWYLYNYRLRLAFFLKERGFQVYFVAPRDDYTRHFISSIEYLEVELDRKSTNPLTEFFRLIKIARAISSINADIIHNYTAKCVLYGTLIALISNTNLVVNSVTGLGHIFISRSMKASILRFLLRSIYAVYGCFKRVRFVFQNKDDLSQFAKLEKLAANPVSIIPGSGIEISKNKKAQKNSKSILFASRLIKEKGIFEFIDALKILKEKNINFQAFIAGSLDKGNPSSLSQKELNELLELKLFTYLGYVDHLQAEMAKAEIFVLPSWREGLPKSLLEAALEDCALVTTNVPGCREVVKDDYNGILVRKESAEEIALALEKILASDELRKKYTQNSYELIKNKFSEEVIFKKTVNLYELA
ncbi:MAG: glycosyltransferase family 4 protein [Oligoflexia bacterium]|nr:glycosyltransferase family 4 protein [Oligoflexia bacterium]